MSSSSNKVAIVGCGLLGSMFARPMCAFATALGVELGITLVDYDIVEGRNSPSDLGVPEQVGKKKTKVVARVYEDAQIIPVIKEVRITEKNTWVLNGHDFIVGALDNVESRLVLLGAAEKLGIPYLDLGLSYTGGAVTWSLKDTITMPFVNAASVKYAASEEKKPACELVGTRVFSAIVTECAITSFFIFLSAHDPGGVVATLTNNAAQQKDMVNWHVVWGDGQIRAIAQFLGNAGG